MGKTRQSANLVSDGNITIDISNDRIGIGSTTPQYKLDVVGDINFTGSLIQNSSPFVASRWTSGIGDNIYRLDGNVGIGTTNPQGTLQIGTGVTISSGIVTATGFVGNVTGNLTGTASTATASGTAYGLTGSPNITIDVLTGTSASFSGNVSVGGTLTYEDVTNVDSVGLITARSGIQVTGNLSAWNTTTPGTGIGGIHLGTASGTSNAGPAITFGGRDAGSPSGSNAQAGIYINSDGTYGTKMYFATTDSYAIGSKVAMSIDHLGAVNISRSNLTVSGTVTATTLVETSSITLKENINPIENALDKILQLNPVTYDRKNNISKNEAGLIAEEVNEIIPNIVSKDSEGNPEGINYTKLSVYLIDAIKTLKKEIEDLRNGNS